MNYTSIEQSKKLLELGMSPETADMHYGNMCVKGLGYSDLFRAGLSSYEEAVRNYDNIKKEYHVEKYEGIVAWEVLPCWSVGALLEIMPIIIRKDKRHYYTLHIIGHRKVIYAKNRCVFHKEIARPLIDACYNMVVWLLENNFIKKRE